MTDPRVSPAAPLAAIAVQFSEQAHEYAVSRAHAEGATRTLLVEHLQPVADEILLDVGSGPAHTALAFAPYVARVIAFDVSGAMLHAARLAARRAAVDGEPGEPLAPLEAVRGDAHALPFGDRAFDLVTIRSAAHHFADLDRALAESRRVLKRGGRLGIADGVVPDDDPELDAFINALDRLHDPTTVRDRSAKEWREALERAGLRVDFADERTFDLAEPRSLTAWIALAGGSSQVLAEARRMLLTAPKRIKDALKVRTSGDDLTFDLPKLVITAKRVD